MSQKEELAKLAENYGLGQDIKMEPRVWKFRPEQRSMRALEAAFKLGEQASRVAALADAEKAVRMRVGDFKTVEEWVEHIAGHLRRHDGVAVLTEGTRNVIRYALTSGYAPTPEAAIRSLAEAPTKEK